MSGDDVLIEETKPMLDNGFVAIVTKYAVGRSAAITYSPAQGPRACCRPAPPRRCARERRGEFKPLVLQKPYQVEFKLRRTFADSIVTQVAGLTEFKLEKVGRPHLHASRPNSAREMG